MTGYLTQRGYIGNGYYSLVIPNLAIRSAVIDYVKF